MQTIGLEFPCDPEPLDSPYYITRFPVEERIYQEINRGGSVIRIKSPKKTGKTSFVLRLLHYAKQARYRTVYLDFEQAEEENYASLNKFLRWLCANVSRQLQLTPMLDNYWDEDIGSKVSATTYFQDYILARINSPLVFVLNEINHIFDYPKIAQEFMPLLRVWHEKAKQDAIWQNLRQVVVHSTDNHINLNINQSPFNIGLVVHLPEFNVEQIQDLAQRHGLNWINEIGKQNATFLQRMVGGHPYLVRLALYNLANSPQKSLEQFLQEAPTITGIYNAYLQRNLEILQNEPELATAFKKVINAESGLELDPILAYKLESMGLVKLVNSNMCVVSCELYRQYFAFQNLEEKSSREQLAQLQQALQRFQYLSNTDDLTQLANKRYFDRYLEQAWQQLAHENSPLSLIVCEIDYFKIYNDTQGRIAGDECLRQVAGVIKQSLKRRQYLAARYLGAEFAIILPRRKAVVAFYIAEIIRRKVKQLAIHHDARIYGIPSRVVTVSLGIAGTIPTLEDTSTSLENAAREALYQSKRNGCDRTTVSSSFNYEYREDD